MTSSLSRPRVLHVVDSLGIGGMEHNLERITSGTGDRFEHHVCCVRRRGALAQTVERNGTVVHDLAFSGRSAIAALSRMRVLMRAVRPAVVHARNWGTFEAVPAARLTGAAGVVFSEHCDLAAPRTRRHEWGRWGLSPWIDSFVVPTPYLSRYLSEVVRIPPTRIRIIANGVDIDRFRPRADREALRLARGFHRSTLVVVTTGRLIAVKEQYRLTEAVARLAPTRDQLRLVLIGDGPERAALERQLAELGLKDKVTITGMRDDVEEWLASADLFVHPSRSEGASNAVLQALASGLPVVATDIEGHRMVISGENGQLVPLDDTNALAAAIATYLDDPKLRCRHGAAARSGAVERFPLSAMVESYAELYNQLARGRG